MATYARIEGTGVHLASDIGAELRRELALLEAEEAAAQEEAAAAAAVTQPESTSDAAVSTALTKPKRSDAADDAASPVRKLRVDAAPHIHNDVTLMASQLELQRAEEDLEVALKTHEIETKHRGERKHIWDKLMDLLLTLQTAEESERNVMYQGFAYELKVLAMRMEQKEVQRRQSAKIAEWAEQRKRLDDLDEDFLENDKARHYLMNVKKDAANKEAERAERARMQAARNHLIEDDDELVREPFQMQYVFLRSTKQMLHR